MLFRRLYNWIKYKTFPPSTLHKQRLLVERDTKHKRITSNFGLNFRNSKWSKYETYNIKPQHLIIYIKIIKNLILLLVIFLLIWSYNKYIIIYYIYNNLLYVYWVCSDAFDHYLFSLMWVTSVAFYKTIGVFYSYFFFNNFSLKKKHIEPSNFSSFSNDLSILKTPTKDIFISKHDLNWTLYSWVTAKTSYKNPEIFKSLFEISLNSKKWNEYNPILPKFFKMTFFLNAIASEWISSLIDQKKNIKKDIFLNIYDFCLSNSNETVFSKTSLNTFTKTNVYEFPYYFQTRNCFKNLTNEWNFFNVNTEFSRYSFLIKIKTGSFFFNNLDYQKFNNFVYNFKELSNINFLIKNQLALAKWNRWLYRYSILHRKVFKNSHKLTLAKRLTNSGFWDSKLFNKNLWISEHYSKHFNNDSFTSLFNLYYNNFFNPNTDNFYFNTKIMSNNSQISNLNSLSHYENSYFFFLKRFYFFNTLSSNLIKTTDILKKTSLNKFQNNIDYRNNIFFKHFILLSSLSRSLFLNLNFVFFSTSYTKNFQKYSNSSNLINLFYSKDIYLLINENNFLSKENLNTLNWITSNLIENNNTIFYDYLNISTHSSFFKNLIYFENNCELIDLNYFLIQTIFNDNDFYSNDLLFLISNYKK